MRGKLHNVNLVQNVAAILEKRLARSVCPHTEPFLRCDVAPALERLILDRIDQTLFIDHIWRRFDLIFTKNLNNLGFSIESVQVQFLRIFLTLIGVVKFVESCCEDGFVRPIFKVFAIYKILSIFGTHSLSYNPWEDRHNLRKKDQNF